MDGTVTILHYNANASAMVSAAGRISTTKGTADEIYRNSCSNEEEVNVRLIDKIMASGHESVLEHISVNLSFDNVSVYVEQFMIEFRLASFTVKSRRYVDFGKMGYVMPDFSQYEESQARQMKAIYVSHMEYLFAEYEALLEAGVPKEDARFVLPYAFRSNFYCTVNARELKKIISEMIYGRGRNIPELVALGQSLLDQCEDMLPYLKVKKTVSATAEEMKTLFGFRKQPVEETEKEELVSLLRGTENPEKIICQAAAIQCGLPGWSALDVEEEEQQKRIIRAIMKNSRRRELEQVSVTILFHRMSLAGVTHLVRHRMQSILVPDYISVCDFEKYILPESMEKTGMTKRYQEAFQRGQQAAERLTACGMKETDGIYLLMSGMTIPVMTTMNGNELNTFLCLRTCNRAQWEIKQCADALLQKLREAYPVLFSLYGPSCYVKGVCPEGRMTCGKKEEMLVQYGRD